MPLFDLIELPFCKIVRIEAWNAEPHRFFIAYNVSGEFRHVLGLPVIDEFATFSSPIFFAPIPILGKIYNAGISLGHKRSPDMDIDSGWPPLCVGTNESGLDLPADFENQLIQAIESGNGSPQNSEKVGDYQVQFIEIGRTAVFATDAPLLPNQLKRIADHRPFLLAFSTGNRVTRQKDGNPSEVRAVSEAVLAELCSYIR